MGQKINPIGIRVGSFITWKSRWFAGTNNFKDYLIEDIKIRKGLMQKLRPAGVTQVEIERQPKTMAISVWVSRPGVVIGRGGSGIEDVKKYILEIVSEVRKQKVKDMKIDIRINEIKNPELSARLVLDRIISDIERRIPHRRSVQKAIERVMNAGALGVKIVLSGRIAGASIARKEKYKEGSIPAQSLKEQIDYAESPASIKQGYIGIKVWIHRPASEE